MKRNPMIALADAVNDRRRTTSALALLVDLIDHAGRTGGPEFDCRGTARAELLDLFVEKMRANDDLITRLVHDAASRAQ